MSSIVSPPTTGVTTPPTPTPHEPPCEYEPRWTDEVGTIPVCTLHGNNSRHEQSKDPHRPCLTVDPYPGDARFPGQPASGGDA